MIVEPQNSKIRYSFPFPEHEMSKCGFHIYIHIDLLKWLKKQCSGDGNRVWTPDLIKMAGKEWFKTELTYVHFLISRDVGLVGITCDGNACGLDLSYRERDHAEREDREWIEYDPNNVDVTRQSMFLAGMASWLDGIYEAETTL
jgi:hypothetical protein